MCDQRKFNYHIISVYIPSLSLFIITLATMHIDIGHFEVMQIHLSSNQMLFFPSVSQILPTQH